MNDLFEGFWVNFITDTLIFQTNAQLLENLDELIDDFKTEPVVDQHTKVREHVHIVMGWISSWNRYFFAC